MIIETAQNIQLLINLMVLTTVGISLTISYFIIRGE